MPSPLVRRSLKWLVFAAVVVGVIATALPYLASARIVRNRIAEEMSSWSGYRVEIGAPPKIEIWPRFRAVVTEVSFSEWGNDAREPVATADRVEIVLSAIAALRGDAEFTSIRVFSPHVRVRQDAQGIFRPAAPGAGRIKTALEIARTAVRDQPDSPDAGKIPDEPLGSIEIVNGTIAIGEFAAEKTLVSGIAGRIDWPALDEGGRISGTGLWRGDQVSIDVQSSNPLLMLAGAPTQVVADVRTAAGQASFTGTAKFKDRPYLDGRATVSAPSVVELARLAGARVPSDTKIGSASISGDISGDDRHIKFDKAEIDVNGNRAQGAVEMVLDPSAPKLSGSLAFDTLDIGSLLAAFAPLTRPYEADRATVVDGAESVDIDLRFSAARATSGTINLTDVAATAQINKALAVFDISDATAFGGSVQAGLRFDRKADGHQIELRLLASDVDGGAFSAAAGMTRLVPVGRGTVSLILKGEGDALESMMETATGSISANFGPGSLTGFDLAAFIQRNKSGGFFALSDVANGNLPIDGLDLEASISMGVAKINRGEVRLGNRRIRVVGVVPYLGRGLALTGVVGPAEGIAGNDEAEFFVGGSWDKPFISPTMTNPPLE